MIDFRYIQAAVFLPNINWIQKRNKVRTCGLHTLFSLFFVTISGFLFCTVSIIMVIFESSFLVISAIWCCTATGSYCKKRCLIYVYVRTYNVKNLQIPKPYTT